MSAEPGPRDSNQWDRGFLLWDCYFAVVWVGTLVLALSVEAPGSAARPGSAALVVLLLVWYVVSGRPVLLTEGADQRRAVRYLTVATALFVASGVLITETRLLTFALVPQCFIALRIHRAMVTLAVINVAPVAGWALLWRPDAQNVFLNSVGAAVSLVFGAALGTWIIHIIAQSQERADLIAELEASREEVARLSTERGALAERERMSREIHDTLAQGFTSLLMLVQAVDAELDHDVAAARRHLELMQATARQNLAEARSLVAGRAPDDLRGGSLPDALRRVAARHGAAVTVTGTARPLPPGLEVVALRSCQEALTNAAKHAGPDAEVRVALGYRPGGLTLVVSDSGCGFDTGAHHEGFGLRGLRTRAAEVSGTAEVVSAPGAGTAVTVRLPLPEPDGAPDAHDRPEPPDSPAPSGPSAVPVPRRSPAPHESPEPSEPPERTAP
ncbi:sensor histidine kinase [Streptomyces flavofungini]|uniref:Sensor histidine kinase n=1 Tax=Streptomyces flavofungini TaxID=68200 RepID=A0ABS0X487_9ACTN|nr:sensor histidine kinase [Streptomyces flavofungini]MBJ3808005.1 sensor histidine kinase [Streptomyces flavofungini]GHC82901.1 two-component sensor histidine kinase [Streptomyces flavofungini]